MALTTWLNADPDVLSCLKRNFYVDDFLKSFHNKGDALRIIAQLTASLERGGFHLTKFSSSHPQILSVLPDSDLSSTMLDLNLDTAETKVLGLIWNPTLDKLEVKVKVKYKPLTRRGILSMISQLFDPIGFLQPFIFPVKLLMQELCHLNLGWDVEIPLDKKVSWYNGLIRYALWKNSVTLDVFGHISLSLSHMSCIVFVMLVLLVIVQ